MGSEVKMTDFKLTYATMFNPPEELHIRFERALLQVRSGLGREHGMIINGKDTFAGEKFEDRNPANTDMVLGIFQKGDAKTAHDALAAARKAFPMWSHLKWQDRVILVRKAAQIMDDRLFEIGAVMAMEVGKNRMESLGDVAETADLLRFACSQMEKNNGYIVEMGRDPLVGYESSNLSVMKPWGVWLVISPFNFPLALTGGPAGAALVSGNTLVMKPASDTPWVVRLLAECFREAGIPDGVVNYVTGPGRTLGNALITCQEVDGVTFTGSFEVGMRIFRDFSECSWVRPIILELGGKNPVIVSRHANLEQAAIGITRSAFGLQGQKCSAASRVFIEAPAYDELSARLKDLTEKMVIGDPTVRNNYLGPVVNATSYQDYKNFTEELGKAGKFLTGGQVLTGGAYDKGYFCAPTLVTDLPLDHRLWKYEMFLPITTIARVSSLEEAMLKANEVDYGLTSGFFGSEKEIPWFFDGIHTGVAYANRPQGATTGAWPGFQPFGGWKASGSSGKNSGGVYYLPQYMHEQIQTIVR
jgi:1-pyrroline-5-carboxylate dehydrogenase